MNYMEEKSKLFVFDRIEVIIIFLFMIVLAVTCFTLGVSVGKRYAIRAAGITEVDEQNVVLKSKQEEYVDQVIEQNKNEVIEETVKDSTLTKDTIDRLSEEFESLENPEKAPQENSAKNEVQEQVPSSASAQEEVKENDSSLVGKYTIQLGSYQTIEDAKAFADGFTIRGYNPIINEVEIPGKGIWYRVSLGIFETVAAAKEYITKESSLFQGQNYIIAEIK